LAKFSWYIYDKKELCDSSLSDWPADEWLFVMCEKSIFNYEWCKVIDKDSLMKLQLKSNESTDSKCIICLYTIEFITHGFQVLSLPMSWLAANFGQIFYNSNFKLDSPKMKHNDSKDCIVIAIE